VKKIKLLFWNLATIELGGATPSVPSRWKAEETISPFFVEIASRFTPRLGTELTFLTLSKDPLAEHMALLSASVGGHTVELCPLALMRRFLTSFRRKPESSNAAAGAVYSAPVLSSLTALDPGLRRGDGVGSPAF